jgi:hypothetical protein
MTSFVRVGLTVGALLIGFSLVGCEDFDPTALLDSEIFNTKKKLPGERIPVFPEGTPGVPQGVPPELVKGYQAPPDPATASREASSKTASKEAPNKEAPNKEAPNKEASSKDASKETSKQAAAEPTELNPKPKPKPKPKVAAKPAGQTTASAAPAPQPAPQSQQWPDQSQTQQAPAAAAWPGSARPSGGVAWPDPPAPR